MATPEGRVKAAVKKALKALPDCFFYMPVQNGMGVHGIPDFLVCWHGRMIAIETKAPGKVANTTQNQKDRLAEIAAAGGITLVVDTADLLRETLALHVARRANTVA